MSYYSLFHIWKQNNINTKPTAIAMGSFLSATRYNRAGAREFLFISSKLQTLRSGVLKKWVETKIVDADYNPLNSYK
jgi:hypothetical protein